MTAAAVLVVLGLLTTVCRADSVTWVTPHRNLTISNEKLLTKHLLETYALAGRGGRPVINSSTPTLLQFGLGLIQMDLDEKLKVLTTSMWTRMKWVDEYLQWNPKDYHGLSHIRMESDDIWTPDIMLFNTADPKTEARRVLVTVFSDGSLQWVPHQIFRSSCSIDVTHFPFDNQTCMLWFGSWTHSNREINLTLAFPEGIDLSTFTTDYKESSEWDIFNTTAERNDSNGYVVVQITLYLQRKLVFSSYILTLPCVFLAFLTLVVFCLPPERPDRTGLAMSLFSSFLVLLLILVEAAPPTASSVPKLGIYYCFNMSIIMLSIFLSSLVVNINKKGVNKKPPPKWVDALFLEGIGRLLLVHKDPCCIVHFRKRRKSRREHTSGQDLLLANHTNAGRNSQPAAYPFQQPRENDTSVPSAAASPVSGGVHSASLAALERAVSAVEAHVGEVHAGVARLLDQVARANHDTACRGAVAVQWRRLAEVLDRLFIVCYLLAIICSLWSMFPAPPWAFLSGNTML